MKRVCKFCGEEIKEVHGMVGQWMHTNGFLHCKTVQVAEPAEFRTFGDRLGETVVEFSECLSREAKSKVLEELEDTTDHAYNQAAIELAFILTEFSARRS